MNGLVFSSFITRTEKKQKEESEDHSFRRIVFPKPLEIEEAVGKKKFHFLLYIFCIVFKDQTSPKSHTYTKASDAMMTQMKVTLNN